MCIRDRLKNTPGGAFGSCRFKLQDPVKQKKEYERLFEVFAAHDIGYFFYNGGGDSQDTTFKVSEMAKKLKFPLQCIGIPKTVDNDLPYTDCSPGFGSVAKYVAISTLEAGLDVKSMAETSTKVFILEVMGRHAGWIAAASCLAASNQGDPVAMTHSADHFTVYAPKNAHAAEIVLNYSPAELQVGLSKLSNNKGIHTRLSKVDTTSGRILIHQILSDDNIVFDLDTYGRSTSNLQVSYEFIDKNNTMISVGSLDYDCLLYTSDAADE